MLFSCEIDCVIINIVVSLRTWKPDGHFKQPKSLQHASSLRFRYLHHYLRTHLAKHQNRKQYTYVLLGKLKLLEFDILIK